MRCSLLEGLIGWFGFEDLLDTDSGNYNSFLRVIVGGITWISLIVNCECFKLVGNLDC